MKCSKAFCRFVSALALTIRVVPSLAIEPDPRGDGFSGRIAPVPVPAPCAA